MKRYVTLSDSGSVLFKFGSSSVLLSNGYGDGLTAVYVYELGESIETEGRWDVLAAVIEGEFELCSCDNTDVSDNSMVKLKGKYLVLNDVSINSSGRLLLKKIGG